MIPKRQREIELWKANSDVVIAIKGGNVSIKKDQLIEVREVGIYYNNGTASKRFYFRTHEGEYEWDEQFFIYNFTKIGTRY